ncbi:hypothetical protein [Picrophilus oshimae]|uniref:Uncharacterized protein n=1 Tax=Picrophilus torridus (strain ATCC 700027 / DSM 9790 / JCM 10055 / NBRC 100828 / KAW 2/3) TaxID=1122961 RepID=Q6L263_PICTO|nr:hypothetical protein [Picrophilus oshimae]AAT42939.1 hypothetical protein PTO0354 [Picrophilus oshimae DSM 9789]
MKQAIRVQQPDGSFKIVFRETDNKNNDRPNTLNKQETKETKENQNNKKTEKKKKEIQDPRYYNPLNPEHIDIFGKDLLNKELIFSLVNGESIMGKMTGFGQYEILIESNNKKLILLKQGIIKIEVL